MNDARPLKRIENTTEYLDIIVANKEGKLYKKKLDLNVIYTVELVEDTTVNFWAPSDIIIESYEVLASDSLITIELFIAESVSEYVYGTVIPKGSMISVISNDFCVFNLNVKPV